MDTAERVARVLPDAQRAGVYHLPAEGADLVAQAARDAGYVYARIELSGCRSKAECLARIAAALSFPQWFGHNWDALADCLGDLSWLPGEGYVFVLAHADEFRAAEADDFTTLLAIFQDAAAEWATEGIPLWSFAELASDGIAHLRSL